MGKVSPVTRMTSSSLNSRLSQWSSASIECKLRVRLRVCSVLLALLTACGPSRSAEIGSQVPYSELIGAKYVVVADNVYAYGVYESVANKTLSFIELLPIQIDGREIAFRKHIPKGQVVEILSAWHHFVLFERGVYFLVRLHDFELPRDVPIRLELGSGNEGTAQLLNPDIYRKLSRKD